jgi:hypothetical protein
VRPEGLGKFKNSPHRIKIVISKRSLHLHCGELVGLGNVSSPESVYSEKGFSCFTTSFNIAQRYSCMFIPLFVQ